MNQSTYFSGLTSISICLFFTLFMLACRGDLRESDSSETIRKGKVLKPEQIAKQVIPQTVFIEVMDNYGNPLGFGSGFVIREDQIVTNFHVIEDAASGFISKEGIKEKFLIEGILACDAVNDLAILNVSGFPVKSGLKLDSSRLEIGETIFVIGNPVGLEATFSDGKVSAIRESLEADRERSLIQITAPISPGSSGGPVVNEYGELIGVAVGAITDGQNLNFAVPAKYVIELQAKINPPSFGFERMNTNCGVTFSTNPENEPTEEEMAMVKIISPKFFNDVSDRYQQSRSANPLIEYTIRNGLQEDIKNVFFEIEVFDGNSNQVDFHEYILEETIYGGKSRMIQNVNGTWLAPSSALEYSYIPINKRPGYTVKFTVRYFEKI